MNDGHPLIKYIVFRGERIQLAQSEEDGFWRDPSGVVYALTDDRFIVDRTSRCGIGLFSLDEKHPLTAACKPHDYMYSSPAFQAFHTRREADAWLRRGARKLDYPVLGAVFEFISGLFGGGYWENKSTR